jgi:hypothetical protein
VLDRIQLSFDRFGIPAEDEGERSTNEAPDVKTVVEDSLIPQREMHAGGDLAPVEELLAEDVVWHVPGTGLIAGDYRGRQAVTVPSGSAGSSPAGRSGRHCCIRGDRVLAARLLV